MSFFKGGTPIYIYIYSNPNLFYLLPKFDLIQFSFQEPINLSALIPTVTAPDPGSGSDVNTEQHN